MEVLVDTTAWIALFDRNQQYHSLVSITYKSLTTQGCKLITSDYVIDELLTNIRKYFDCKRTRTTYELLELAVANNELSIIQTDKPLFDQTKIAFFKYFDQGLSFTDTSLYILAKNREIKQIFTLDSDFAQIGLVTVPTIK